MKSWTDWLFFVAGVALIIGAYAFFTKVIELLSLAGHDGLALLGSAIFVWLWWAPLGFAILYNMEIEFPLSGYNGNDSTESGDIDGE